MANMSRDETESVQTRPSLLHRLRSGDQESWEEFYRLYGKVVRDFSIQAGLTDTEADEVVQDTAVAIFRHLPGFQYDPKVCRFKTWLLNQASWRIKDQLRRRRREVDRGNDGVPAVVGVPTSNAEETMSRSAIGGLPDSAPADLEGLFDAEWRKNLLAAAMKRVRARFSLKQLQVFDLLVQQEWPAADVARSLGLTRTAVYVTKHRIAMALRHEATRLEREMAKPGFQ